MEPSTKLSDVLAKFEKEDCRLEMFCSWVSIQCSINLNECKLEHMIKSDLHRFKLLSFKRVGAGLPGD